jgi:hypothetical protein
LQRDAAAAGTTVTSAAQDGVEAAYLDAVTTARLGYLDAELQAQRTHDERLAARLRTDAEADGAGRLLLAQTVAAADYDLAVFAADRQREADLSSIQLGVQTEEALLTGQAAVAQTLG